VYVVCPRIDAGDTDNEAWINAAAVVDVTPTLAEDALAGLRVEMLHGRMTADAKDDVMRRFSAGDIDVLVATTVIEVGVDVPNATAMIVLDADRFGISQLHQLRGRIGRGQHPGVCLLVTAAEIDAPSRERLDGVAATVDGFELARLDLGRVAVRVAFSAEAAAVATR
jgi:ATP-dependent DNA helicase RecG